MGRAGRTRGALRGVLFAVFLVVAAVAGFAAVVATARVAAWPWVFLGVGGVVFAAAGAASARVLAARRRRGLVVVGVLTVLGAVALLVHAPGTVPGVLPGTRWVHETGAGTRWAAEHAGAGGVAGGVAGGARLAYRELPGAGRRHRTPVIFLHGGPGVADMGGDIPYLRRLAAAGWDTYIYDQLGAGRSSRLADPTGYTLARAVADLDAIRRATGAARVDLLGYSWGSTLAAAYLAAHPGHVDKVVFASPGPMTGGASDVTDLLGHAGAGHAASVLGQVLPPRPLLTWTLDQVDPRAAHAVAGDAEMDARFRTISAAAAPALYCHPPRTTTGGDPGFYANATLLRRTAWRDPHPALRRLATPALVIKGQCDYLTWSSAVDYRDTLRRGRLVYLPGAGHRAYAERPAAFFATVDAFLSGRAPPIAPYDRTAPPPGYRGPR